MKKRVNIYIEASLWARIGKISEELFGTDRRRSDLIEKAITETYTDRETEYAIKLQELDQQSHDIEKQRQKIINKLKEIKKKRYGTTTTPEQNLK